MLNNSEPMHRWKVVWSATGDSQDKRCNNKLLPDPEKWWLKIIRIISFLCY
jgi:hypothetical protein